MAFITKEYMDALRESKLFDKQDIPNLSELTKEKGLRDGKGYQKNQIRNFLNGYTTTDDIVQLIMNYFSAKKQMQEKLKQQQKSFAEKLKEEVA